MTYNELAELFKREGGDAQVCFSVISQNQILFGNNNTKKNIISFKNDEPIKWVKGAQEEPVSEDLEEAAEKYAYEICPSIGIANTEIKLAFKAGARWDRQRTIEKTVKWLTANLANYFGHESAYTYIDDFRKALEE